MPDERIDITITGEALEVLQMSARRRCCTLTEALAHTIGLYVYLDCERRRGSKVLIEPGCGDGWEQIVL